MSHMYTICWALLFCDTWSIATTVIFITYLLHSDTSRTNKETGLKQSYIRFSEGVVLRFARPLNLILVLHLGYLVQVHHLDVTDHDSKPVTCQCHTVQVNHLPHPNSVDSIFWSGLLSCNPDELPSFAGKLWHIKLVSTRVILPLLPFFVEGKRDYIPFIIYAKF